MLNKKIEVIPNRLEVELAGIPPLPSVKAVPNWYKEIPQFCLGDKDFVARNGLTNATVKRCVPFLDSITSGYMFVLNNDVQIWWKDGEPIFEWGSGTRNIVSFHDAPQVANMPIPEGYYERPIKWVNDYMIKTPKEYSLYCMHPANRFDLPFLTFSGFVDTDMYENPIQFPFLLKEKWEGIIEAGTPLAQLIPIKRENWEINLKPYDEKRAYVGLENLKRKLERSYKNNTWAKKNYK